MAVTFLVYIQFWPKILEILFLQGKKDKFRWCMIYHTQGQIKNIKNLKKLK